MSIRIGLRHAGFVLLIATIGFSAWWFLMRSPSYGGWLEVASEQLNQCEVGSCVELAPMNLPHAGSITFRYYPGLEDGVTEWAVCMQTLLDCSDEDDISGCITVPQCPAECMRRLAETDGITASHENLFDGIEKEFLNENAYCGVPND